MIKSNLNRVIESTGLLATTLLAVVYKSSDVIILHFPVANLVFVWHQSILQR